MVEAVGDRLGEDGAVSAEAAAGAVDAWMRAKPAGIGNTVRRGILHYRHTGRTEVHKNAYDAGNGAALREPYQPGQTCQG